MSLNPKDSIYRLWKRWTRNDSRSHTEASAPHASSSRAHTHLSPASPYKTRSVQLESLELRCMFNVDPIWVGAVYIEEDSGSDAHGDSFYINFRGGAANTQLTRLVIGTDQGQSGYTVADNLFDTVDGGRGADHAHPFRIESLEAKDPNAKVSAQVVDGSMQLILTFENFYAGDRLRFSIDVDEVQHIYSLTDISEFNDGLDPITSGAEFEGSKMIAEFQAPGFEDATSQGLFINRYDTLLTPSGLDLPKDNDGGKRDRTAGLAIQNQQLPKPISLAGIVYVDNNLDLIQNVGEPGIAGVQLELYRREGSSYTSTGYKTTTNANGQYEFGLSLGIPPGTYQIRETQPNGYFSVGATPGLLNGKSTLGDTILGNPDALTQIDILDGGSFGTELNFAEAQPARISGFVYRDNNDDGIRQPSEGGIANTTLQIVSLYTITGETIERTTTTAADGAYQFLALPPGTYEIREVQPAGFFDGKDSVGRVGTETRGLILVNDEITSIQLFGNNIGVNYNFGEIEPASLSGHVCLGLPGFSCFSTDPAGSQPLEGVRIDLVDETGAIIATTFTLADGNYQFENLPIGVYTIIETQPADLIDGASRAGTVDGNKVGTAKSGTRIDTIQLYGGNDGIGYDFCERLPAKISGKVFVDLDGDRLQSPSEEPIENVEIELYDEFNRLVATTRTDANGYYEFGNLPRGTYSIREIQPVGYFQGGQRAGSLGGNDSSLDRITSIVILDGADGVNYDFCETPPAILSGYVFQDGGILLTENGLPPSNLTGIRDGVRTPDDTPLPGVVLELRRIDGAFAGADETLPGIYADGVIQVVTDANGYYEFRGLKPGLYHIYELQPLGIYDGIDTAGSTGGTPVNPNDPITDPIVEDLLRALQSNPATNPNNDGILLALAIAGVQSIENNFSEVLVGAEPNKPPEEPDPPVPPIDKPNPPPEPPRIDGSVPQAPPRFLVLAPPLEPFQDPSLAGYSVEYTWHLSIINAGEPRGFQNHRLVEREALAKSARVLNLSQWTIDSMNMGRWKIVSSNRTKPIAVSREAFSIRGAKQLAGDFNGDGHDELALFKDGEWLLDMNGNGQWDKADLWARLGQKGDLPVVGDWDGDGKDDIGIYGIAWTGDREALKREPGLPDPENSSITRPKNIPPRLASDSHQVRLMQRTSKGEPRSDAIDHVFQFGAQEDQPIAGDFNGDGISTLGSFQNGIWKIDVNGDGNLDSSTDAFFEFGQAGDVAIVGDFNGDGLDEIAIVRGNTVIVDSNGNGRLDVTDRVFEIEGSGDGVVVGDFDGDGIDEAAFYSMDPQDKPDGFRQARAG